ncbi:MAG: hypothetical protein IT243_02850 [Bacteroidia bacterium]|nr:hypothetical protein [Bacteroidia bacterium]
MSKKNINTFNITFKSKKYLSQNDGLGYLQIFNLLKTLSIVVVSIILAKTVKNQSYIAKWETLMLFSGSFTFFYVSGLGYTLLSFIKKYPPEKYISIFKNAFFLLFSFGLFSCLAIVLTEIFSNASQTSFLYILLFCIYVLGNVCSSVLEYYFLIFKQYKILIWWGIFNFIAFVLSPCIIIFRDFYYAIFALSILGVLKFVFIFFIIKKPFDFGKLEFIKPLLKFNIPVILSLLLGTGYIYIANFIAKASVNDSDFNLFRYGSREFPVFMVLANSYSIVLGSIASSNNNTSDFWVRISKNHRRLLFQLFPLAIILMIFSPFIFKILFSDSFVSSSIIFNILLLTLIARVVFPQSLLLGYGISKYSFWASLVEFVSGTILSLIFVKQFGISGIAWSITIAYFIEKIILIIFCYKIKIPFHKSINLKWFLIFTVLLIISFIYNLIRNV